MLLSIDTSSRYGGVALADASGQVIEARLWRSTANHTAQLLPAVAELLAAQHITAAELGGVAVALGPGPFSALRVGVSAAKGFAMAGGLPIVGIDTLQLEAGPHLTPDGIVAAWLDAGRNEVAAGWFQGDGERAKGDAIASPAVFLEREPALPAGPLIYCGEAAHAGRNTIRDADHRRVSSRPVVVAPWTPASRLWHLAAEGSRRLQSDAADALATLQPYYLRMPTIGAPRQRDRVRPGLPAPSTR